MRHLVQVQQANHGERKTKLLPRASLPDVCDWLFCKLFLLPLRRKIGVKIADRDWRIAFHEDSFTSLQPDKREEPAREGEGGEEEEKEEEKEGERRRKRRRTRRKMKKEKR